MCSDRIGLQTDLDRTVNIYDLSLVFLPLCNRCAVFPEIAVSNIDIISAEPLKIKQNLVFISYINRKIYGFQLVLV